MTSTPVSLAVIHDAIRVIRARGETPSIRRVQQEVRRDYAGISQLMRANGMVATAMNRTLSTSRSGHTRGDDKAARRCQPCTEPSAMLGRSLESAPAPEPSTQPYKTFLIAMLQQALKDTRSGSTDNRRAAWHWLQADPACAEICDWLAIDHRRLLVALEARGAGTA